MASSRTDNVHRPPIVRYTPNVFGFPDRLMTKLRYVDIQNNVSTVGALVKHVFRWNSTFDPDFSVAGHQPLYRDTYASVYDQYSVVSARAKIRFDNPNIIGFVVGVLTDDDTSTSTTFQTLMEQNHGQSDTLTTASGSHSSREFIITWDCASVLNIDPYTSEAYKTAVGSDPTEVSTLIVWSLPIDASTTATIQFKIELEQDVLWTELTTPSQS